MRPRLPIPDFYDPALVGAKPWKVDYLARAGQAEEWARKHDAPRAAADKFKVCLMLIDVQNTFCVPGFELFVGGRSGNAAVEDNDRICRVIYANLSNITQIVATMDTHFPHQIFHPVFWVDRSGNHPQPGTQIPVDDLKSGKWKVNPSVAWSVAGGNLPWLERHALAYTEMLAQGGRYTLTVWPYHAMLGGIGHALVSSVEEAIFFHGIARKGFADFRIKGGNYLTEHYSIIQPEVLTSWDQTAIDQKNTDFLNKLLRFDMVIIGGQAKSHCVAWTINHLLNEIMAQDPLLAGKVYLLEDATSPVVIPGVYDFTPEADEAFERFRKANMHIVRSTSDMNNWPGV
jgi:nicotinamidase-related amidase